MTRYIGITGVKKAGKTTTIEFLVPKLKAKKFRIGTVKIAFKDVSIDVDETHYDVLRQRNSSPEKTMFQSSIETVIFYNNAMELAIALEKFGQGLDIVLIEGFPKDLEGMPQIALIKELTDKKTVINDYTQAISSIPEFSIKTKDQNFVEFINLPEIVEEHAQQILPGLDCKHCGYDSCNDLMKEIVKGNKKAKDCYVIDSTNMAVALKVNKKEIPCNPFVQSIFKNVIDGIVKTIKINETELSEIEVIVRYNKKNRNEDKK